MGVPVVELVAVLGFYCVFIFSPYLSPNTKNNSFLSIRL